MGLIAGNLYQEKYLKFYCTPSELVTSLAQGFNYSSTSPKSLPAIKQVEMNLLWQQKKLRKFCKEKGVHITTYSPLGENNTKWGDNRIVESDVIAEIAKAKAKTAAQVALRWAYEQGSEHRLLLYAGSTIRAVHQVF